MKGISGSTPLIIYEYQTSTCLLFNCHILCATSFMFAANKSYGSKANSEISMKSDNVTSLHPWISTLQSINCNSEEKFNK